MIYNLILEGFVLPLGDFFFGGSYLSKLKIVRKEVLLSESEIDFLQKKRLAEILSYAKIKSSYYSKLIPNFNYNDPYSVIQEIPILTKEIIRLNRSSLLTTSIKKLTKLSSSGSTGIQTDVYLNRHELSFDRAIQTHWWEWAGYRIGMPMVQTGLSTNRSFEKKVKDILFQVYYAFAFAFNRENIGPISNYISSKKAFLGGYASSLYTLSELLKDRKYRCSSAISWGDKLFDHYKLSIENTFQCKVYETYGTGEGFKIASQRDLDHLYIMSPYVYLELLDDDGLPVPDGTIGHVVVTSLINYSMPLIRYRLGDLAVRLPRDEYPINRALALPLLKKVIGRETDLISTPRGKKLIVHSFTGVFEHYSSIRQFCVVQEVLDGILVKYIRGLNFNPKVLDEIKIKLLHFIDEPFLIEFCEVDYIPNTPSGKPQIVISKLKK